MLDGHLDEIIGPLLDHARELKLRELVTGSMTPAPPARRARRKLLGAATRLLRAGGIESPRLDAEILLASALGASRFDSAHP